MNIFIDESGSFVDARAAGSWNVIAAYLSPEQDRRALQLALKDLKLVAGVRHRSEVKLKHLSEQQYFKFLDDLRKQNGALISVATDAGLNGKSDVIRHQQLQAELVCEHLDRMIHENARIQIQALSRSLRDLSPQLYVQLQCQVRLILLIIEDGIMYFVQRTPKSLGRFRWRIDQKNTSKIEYEKAFETLAPPMVQSASIRRPIARLVGADYSAFKRFNYSEENRPTYLEEVYGIEPKGDGPGSNIGKLLKEDLQFVDSRETLGIQVADLLASGLRRCLRLEFEENRIAARKLGSLMVQAPKGEHPVRFLGFSQSHSKVTGNVAIVSRIMNEHCRSMIAS